jgi:hypothetical protein
LNSLLNYAGARLRDLALTRYPFPDPDYYQIREYADGSKKILDKRTAEANHEDSIVKSYWKAGYRGNSKHPRVLLTHPTLSGLDFVDMIRAHVIEMCRQCFIQNVPRADSHRYIRLLIHRLRPFLDWVFTQGETGRKNFYPEADRELRRLVLEIRALYGRRSGRIEPLSRQLHEELPKVGIDFLRSKALDVLNAATDEATKDACQKILNHIEHGNVVTRDVEKLMDQVISASQREGNDWHRVLLSDTVRPSSLRSVVFGGDRIVAELSDIMIASEVPVLTSQGMGKADLVVFVRREIKGKPIWTPIIVLDIKTKTAFKFNLYGVRPKTKKSDVFAPSLFAWKTHFTKDEWDGLVNGQLTEKELDQLNAYEAGLISEYKRLVSEDIAAPLNLWKGIVIVDTNQTYFEVVQAFQQLLDDAIQGLTTKRYDPRKGMLLQLKSKEEATESPHIGLVLLPTKGPIYALKNRKPLASAPIDNPFENRVVDDRLLTIYVSVPSPTSSGIAATWASKVWHLLNHLQECMEPPSDSSKVLWIDLLGDFSSSKLVEARFGLKRLVEGNQITRKLKIQLSQTLDNIDFLNLSSIIDGYLLEDSAESLQEISRQIRSTFEELDTKDIIVVIDGWGELEALVTPNRRHLLRTLEHSLLDLLPKHGLSVIWVDRGANHPSFNGRFQRQRVSPLRFDSPRNALVDEIIWNLPTPPRVFGWLTPFREDMRVIVQDIPSNIPPWTASIYVPSLHDWARKIRGVTDRRTTVDVVEIAESDKKTSSMYGRYVTLSGLSLSLGIGQSTTMEFIEADALELVPSLMRPKGEVVSQLKSSQAKEIWDIIYSGMDSTRDSVSLSKRIQLEPQHPPPVPNRLGTMTTGLYVEADRITRGWFYREDESDSKDGEFYVSSRRPPAVKSTTPIRIDTITTRRLELRRLLYAAQYLKTRFPRYEDIRTLFGKIVLCCEEGLSSVEDEGNDLLDYLQRIEDILESDKESKELWELLISERYAITKSLGLRNQEVFREKTFVNPRLTHMYGNNLFLAVMAAIRELYGTNVSSSAIDLWRVVSEWQLVQLGFQRDLSSKLAELSKYDFHAIYANLLWRTRTLHSTPPPAALPQFYRFGQFVWTEDDGRYDMWMIIPDMDSEQLLGGLVVDLSQSWLGWGYHPGIIDPESLFKTARKCIGTSERMTFAVMRVKEEDILWVPGGEELDEWHPFGVVEYGKPPDGEVAPLRWWRISSLPENIAIAVRGFTVPEIPEGITRYVDQTLTMISEREAYARNVRCSVSVDSIKQVYRVEFRDSESNRILEAIEIASTKTLRAVLRHPIWTGTPYETGSGELLIWDYMTDVEYASASDEEPIDLTFLRPIIHRSSFYPQNYIVPTTCATLLRTSLGAQINLRILSNERLRERGVFRCFRVEFEGPAIGPRFRGLESKWMSIYDVALLADCEQLVDVDMGRRYPLILDIGELDNFKIPQSLSQFPRFHEKLRGKFDLDEDSESDWEEASFD